MSTSVYNYSKPVGSTNSGRFGIWVSRLPLIAITAIFTIISAKFLISPVQSAAAQGISFNSGVGVTVARIGFGAFPLAFAIIALSCLISRRRLLAGIYIVLTLITVVLVVRVFGMIADNSVRESMPVLAPEIVLGVLSVIALNLEKRRRRFQPDTEISD
jgi:hypothetical protein